MAAALHHGAKLRPVEVGTPGALYPKHHWCAIGESYLPTTRRLVFGVARRSAGVDLLDQFDPGRDLLRASVAAGFLRLTGFRLGTIEHVATFMDLNGPVDPTRSRTYRTRRTVDGKGDGGGGGQAPAPQTDGRPGFLRVDTVHQGNGDGPRACT